MNIVLLGGNSQRNKPWIHAVAKQFEHDFDTLIVHEYAHWDDNGELIDFEAELLKLEQEVDILGDYVIFAKSAGSLLTLEALSQGTVRPKALIFAGLPIKFAVEHKIDLPRLLKANTLPTAIVQNTNDPLAPYAGLMKYLEIVGSENYLGVELPGDNHSYDDLQKLQLIVRSVVHSVS